MCLWETKGIAEASAFYVEKALNFKFMLFEFSSAKTYTQISDFGEHEQVLWIFDGWLIQLVRCLTPHLRLFFQRKQFAIKTCSLCTLYNMYVNFIFFLLCTFSYNSLPFKAADSMETLSNIFLFYENIKNCYLC